MNKFKTGMVAPSSGKQSGFQAKKGRTFERSCSLKMPEGDKFTVAGYDTGLTSANQLVQALNEALQSGELAVIHYDPGVLDAQDPSIWQTVIGFHVSVIVAKVEMRGMSYYLLRNSWGANCQIYDASIAGRCDRGHVWLTEEEIRKYVTSVGYLKRVP